MTNLEIQNAYMGSDQVAKIYLGSEVVWPTSQPEPVYSAMPLTFEIISGGTITWKRGRGTVYEAPERTIQYSINDGEWTSITSTFNGVSFNVETGDIVKFKGNNTFYATTLGQQGNTLLVSGYFKMYGNLCSLISPTNYTSISSTEDSTFSCLFQGNTGLTEVTNLSLGRNRMGLSNTSLKKLFADCSNLNYIKIMMVCDIMSNKTQDITSGVAASGTFVKPAAMTYWLSGVNGIPTGWTVVDV